MEVALESMDKPLSYYWNEAFIKIKHIIKRLLYNLRKIKSYRVPKEVANSIDGVCQECLKHQTLKLIHASNQELKDMINSVYQSPAYITLFKNCNIRKFKEEDFISVDVNDIVKKLQNIDKLIETEERSLNNRKYYQNSNPDYITECQQRFELIKQFYTIELNAISKYFTYGKPINESIPLGKEMNVDPVVD